MAVTLGQSTTKVSFETFKTISDSSGQFTTYADLIKLATLRLPINDEFLGASFKSITEVVGSNVELSNITNKYLEYFRSELTGNNKLEYDKMTMHIYNAYMAPFEYSSYDEKSALDWASLVAQSINKMFEVKQDIANAIALDEIQKITLGLGEFHVIKNGDKSIMTPDGSINFDAYKQLAISMIEIQNDKMKLRTKFARGINKNRWSWLNSPNFGVKLLAGQTAGYSGSNLAYLDLKNLDHATQIFGLEFRQSRYLGDYIPMQEFTPSSGTQSGQKQNTGIFTGNLVEMFDFRHLLSIGWIPDSLLYLGNQLRTTERPQTNTRLDTVLTFTWKAQAAIIPLLAHFNHAFISTVPSFASYTKVDGTTVAAMNLTQFEDWKKYNKKTLAQQPALYNHLFNSDGVPYHLVTKVTDQSSWTNYITASTIVWPGGQKDAKILNLRKR